MQGTGRVADDLYLIAHDDVTGRPVLAPRPLGLGLAAGLLAELILTGLADVAGGCVTPGRSYRASSGHAPPPAQLAMQIAARIARENARLAVADWLAFLAQRSAGEVAARLAGDGYLAWTTGRSRWRAGRWLPADPDCAFVALARAGAALDHARPVTDAGAALTGLACACGLEPRILACAPPGTRRSLPAAVAYLPPPVRQLIAATRAAVDSALLGYRT